MKKYSPYFIVIYLIVMMIIYPEHTIICAKSALDICYEIIIPSLFPFFVCSGLLIYSGLCEQLSKLCRPIMKPLFNIGGSGAAALVLGIISGYPLGAITACQLYESGYLSKTETERLLAFCNNSGPLFILGAVGSAIYSSYKIGIALYISHILAALTVGMIFRFYHMDKHNAPLYNINQSDYSFSEVFSMVLSGSINSILTVCGAVIFFSVVTNILTAHLPADSLSRALLTGILELTGGTMSISQSTLSLTWKLVLSAFVVGFAGICVHLQVMAVVKKQNLSLIPYVAGKFLHGLLSGLYMFCYLSFCPPAEMVFKNTSAALDAGFCMSSLYSAISYIFIFLLALLTLIFVFLAAKRKSKV